MGRIGEKFLLLMWKNYKLQIRHPVQFFFQIMIPVFFCAQLLLFRGLVDPEFHPEGKEYEPFEIKLNRTVLNVSQVVTFSPCNPRLTKLMPQFIPSKCVNDSQTLENTLKTELIINICGVQFDDSLAGNVELPKNMHIIFRFPGEVRSMNPNSFIGNWQTDLLFPVYSAPGPRDPDRNEGATPEYNQEGFLTLQKEISMNLIKYYKALENPGNFNPPEILMQRFPYPPWIEDFLLMALKNVTGLMLICSFLVSATYTIKALTNEKESQIKEAMKIMGLPNWLHWTAWFLKTFVLLFFSAMLVVLLFKIKFPNPDFGVLTLSNVGVIILLMILYVCATITLCFAVSVFFTQANTAAAVGALVWFLLYFPYVITDPHYDSLSHTEKMSLCLGSNSALPLAFSIILNFEGQGVGLQWDNIWQTTSPDDTLTVGHVMIMLVVDTFLYLFIALYVEAIYPGEFGVAKPWYFLFTQSFWCGQSRSIGVGDAEEKVQNNPDVYEKDPTNLPVGIEIKHLGKVYANKKTAVKDFNLNMYEGHITVLLGHNGAGKTTTMSMLTGLFPPSSGTAVISGYDIVRNMDKVRDSLGLCPQYNIIFNELTVNEHLYFFGKLKGLGKTEIKREVDRYTELLELVPKKDTQASKLSGGMKRKLCIGIALCGKSKIVLLDEPTAGVDPAARRAVWNILQTEKVGRTILLSTHFMDEADLLGDRIAIMAGGQLQSCGSSFFLKKKFGAGYYLIMEKEQDCQVDAVTSLLRRHIPDIKVENNVGSELTYCLSEDNSPLFEPMLRDLENNSKAVGINSYGISLTTLEEVFMKVGADKGQEEEMNGLDHSKNGVVANGNGVEKPQDVTPHDSQTALHMEGNHYVTGFQLFKNQLFAMFMKRVLSTWRSWILLLIQVLIPVIFIILTMVTAQNMKFGKDLPNIDLSLSKYEAPVTVLNGSSPYKDFYVNIVKEQSEVLDFNDKDLSANVLIKAEEAISTFRRNYIIGATFSTDTIIAWFNNEPYHSPPLALEFVINSILKKEASPNYNIKISNHPLPYSLDTKFKLMSTGASVGLQIATNVGLSMAFVSSFYILFYVKERMTGAKHLQYVSGARVSTLWSVSFLWDFLIFVVISVCLVITLVCYQEDGYKSAEDLGRIFLVLLLFALAVLPMTYLASFLFQIPSSGYTYLSVFNVFAGIMTFMIVTVLSMETLDLTHIAKGLHWAFLLFPHYTLSSALQNMNVVHSSFQLCNTIISACEQLNQTVQVCEDIVCTVYPKCCDVTEDYFTWEQPGIGKNIFYSFLVFGVLTTCLFLMEYGIFKWIVYSISEAIFKVKAIPEDPSEDNDVSAEKQKIRLKGENELGQYALALRDVTKYYRKFLAVNQVCLGVNKYECFGLLGANGAGKTSTFKMMTGDEKISSGDAWVNGMNLKSRMKDVYKVIGYCPQFDALLDNLTGRETLIMFSLLRGIKFDESKYIAEKFSKDFDFHRHIDKKIKEYSGGNKRKLSTALALIGDPQIIYLDEPTTGMDPATKRHIWNNINNVRDSGKCIILTSHSMEECEALCTRLAIMVNGNFKCLGSTQHLKNKFSQGYTLTIKVRKSDVEESPSRDMGVNPVAVFVKANFPTAELRESYQEMLSYYIPDSSIPWSRMFGIMERGKKQLNIEDYSLGQCSLEQVFLLFTKYQRAEKPA